jgi:SAM-dependent methyltransferase
MSIHPLLSILECPLCRDGRDLIAQTLEDRGYLACATCTTWYPIRDEVVILLEPGRNPAAMRRPIGPPSPLPLARRPANAVDLKALVYGFYERMDEFGKSFDLHREALVVDVGCSTGSLAVWLRPEQTYIGFDLSFESLRFARRNSGQFFVQADAERLPIKSGSIPFVVSREVLEHLKNPLAAAGELGRIAHRGVVVVPTLDFPFLYDPINWVLLRYNRRLRFGVYGYGHERLHDVAGWRRLIEEGGLEVRRECTIGTGLALNASDVVWHALYSWRNFDDLPRRRAPLRLARLLFPVWRATHRLDRRLFSGGGLSRAFEVVPRATPKTAAA